MIENKFLLNLYLTLPLKAQMGGVTFHLSFDLKY